MTVLISGIVAVILNLILPQEDTPHDDDDVEVLDVEADPPGPEKD